MLAREFEILVHDFLAIEIEFTYHRDLNSIQLSVSAIELKFPWKGESWARIEHDTLVPLQTLSSFFLISGSKG